MAGDEAKIEESISMAGRDRTGGQIFSFGGVSCKKMELNCKIYLLKTNFKKNFGGVGGGAPQWQV